MPGRKRTRRDFELEDRQTAAAVAASLKETTQRASKAAKRDEDEAPVKERSILQQIRDMWEFPSLVQFLSIFGGILKVTEDTSATNLEAECLKSEPSEVLASIGLSLLKFLSSHRGLTPEIFDEYTRRQYRAKLPQRNPFGDAEQPRKFNDFDIFLRVLFPSRFMKCIMLTSLL
jgi:hypothetical protein